QSGGRAKSTSKQAVVVLNKKGKVITACLLVDLALPPLCITFSPVLTAFKMAKKLYKVVVELNLLVNRL
ncbi:hypothetical protein ACUOFC_63970, partial [Escherichia sp. TWPC-MK]